ncbi:MAG: hypothetical protein EBX41_02025 [Chitinophagia bacterium]|nr:hypothetical protein [Chitinophagia bacterium]
MKDTALYLLLGIVIGFALYHIAYRNGSTSIKPIAVKGSGGTAAVAEATVEQPELSLSDSLLYENLHAWMSQNTGWLCCKNVND